MAGTGTRRKAQKRETRSLILTTARRLFHDQGFQATTIRHIAAAAGVGLGTIHQHFETKAGLLAAAFHDDLNAVEDVAFTTIRSGTMMEQFTHVIRHFYYFHGRRPDLSRIYLKETLFLQGGWQEMMTEQLDRFFSRMGNAFAAATDAHTLRPDLTGAQVTALLFPHYLYILLTELGEPVYDPDRAITTLSSVLQLAFQGVRKADAPPLP